MSRVSVITPCYNSARFLGATVESVQRQHFTDWEHVVVDDGSTDGSAEVVAAYAAREGRLRLVRQANGGVSRARNAGYRASNPESAYVLFLDADDVLEPSMLARLVAYLDQHPGVGLVHCEPAFIDADGQPLQCTWPPRYAPSRFGVQVLSPDHVETPFVSIFTLAGIIPSLSLMRRSVYAQTSGWDEEFGQICEDTDLILQITLRSTVHYLPERLVLHRKHGASSTADPDRFVRQERKLYAKWNSRTMDGLTEEQRAVLCAAEQFRLRRLIPYLGLIEGTRHLRRGDVTRALRYYGGALRRGLGMHLSAG